MNSKEQYIKVSDILNYCRQSAKTNRELANKCIESVGKGESETSSLGGAAYFLQQATMFGLKRLIMTSLFIVMIIQFFLIREIIRNNHIAEVSEKV